MAESEKIPFLLEPHHALNLLAFLEQLEFEAGGEATYLRNSIDEYKKEVYRAVTKEMVEDAKLKVKIEIMLGNAPNRNSYGDKIV